MLRSGRTGMKWQNQGIKHFFPDAPLQLLGMVVGCPLEVCFSSFLLF